MANQIKIDDDFHSNLITIDLSIKSFSITSSLLMYSNFSAFPLS